MMSKQHCCPECFGDLELEKQIFPFLGAKLGDCNFCKTKNTPVISPSKLVDYFKPLIHSYKPDKKGQPLLQLLKEDWQLLVSPNLTEKRAEQLLSLILNDDQIAKRKFSAPYNETQGVEQWKELKKEIMYKNRWFLDTQIDLNRLQELLNHLLAKNLPEIWFRARLTNEEKIFPIQEMGAPPYRLTSHGRANTVGIPYLYLGSKPETAVAEVRPNNDEKSCVAEFLVKDLNVVDLCNPRKRVSPFIQEDSDAISMLRADLPFLEQLGNELTRPVLPIGAAIDYIPSQYLCEFIKKQNFDGVIYSSSVSDGINLALFDQKKATGKETVKMYKAKVSVTAKILKRL